MRQSDNTYLYDFFEVVRVIDTHGVISEIDKSYGVIIGMSTDEAGHRNYAVEIYRDTELTDRVDCWSVNEEHLAATGRKVNEEFIYDGSTIKVPASKLDS